MRSGVPLKELLGRLLKHEQQEKANTTLGDFHCFVVSKISDREENVASVSIPTLGEGDTLATYERISGISGDESDRNADVFLRIEISDVRGADEDSTGFKVLLFF